MKVIYLKPTERCNLHCLHCYNEIEDISSFMDISKLPNVLKEISEYFGDDEPFKISIHGGEPTLVGSEKIEEICKISQDTFKKLIIGLQSNLATKSIDKKLCEVIKKYMDSWVGSSYTPYLRFCGKDSPFYNVWLNNLKLITDEDIKVSVVVTPSKPLVENIQPVDLVKFLIENKITSFTTEALYEKGNAIENWSDIFIDSINFGKWKLELTKAIIDNGLYKDIIYVDLYNAVRRNQFNISDELKLCSTNNIVINSDYSFSYCTNQAKLHEKYYSFEEYMKSKLRQESIMNEKRIILKTCLSCDSYGICSKMCMNQTDCFEGKEFFKYVTTLNSDVVKHILDNGLPPLMNEKE